MVASARTIRDFNNRHKGQKSPTSGEPWQVDAWEMFGAVGELAFLTSTLASRVAKAELFVGVVAGEPGAPPERPGLADPDEGDRPACAAAPGRVKVDPALVDAGLVDVHPDPALVDPVLVDAALVEGEADTEAADLAVAEGMLRDLRSNGLTASAIERLALNLFVAGECWLVGVPRQAPAPTPVVPADPNVGIPPVGAPTPAAAADPAAGHGAGRDVSAIADHDWMALSLDEISADQNDIITIKTADDQELTHPAANLHLVRIWRPHPKRASRATSSVETALPILREIVSFTARIAAQNSSRVAGAGLLLVPEEIRAAIQKTAYPDWDATNPDQTLPDALTTSLLHVMMTPISDPESASAVVPMVLTGPGEHMEDVRHLTFHDQLDSAADMRDRSIHRLALSQDAPPEVLMGQSGANHWTSWLTQQDVVDSHVAPTCVLLVEAITQQLLWLALEGRGWAPERARKFAIWFDVGGLAQKPNHGTHALELHSRNLLSDEALRGVLGFGEGDAPREVPEPVRLALELVRAHPTLLENPGLPVLVGQIKTALVEVGASSVGAGDNPTNGGGGVGSPATADEPVTALPGPGTGAPGGQAPDTMTVPELT